MNGCHKDYNKIIGQYMGATTAFHSVAPGGPGSSRATNVSTVDTTPINRNPLISPTFNPAGGYVPYTNISPASTTPTININTTPDTAAVPYTAPQGGGSGGGGGGGVSTDGGGGYDSGNNDPDDVTVDPNSMYDAPDANGGQDQVDQEEMSGDTTAQSAITPDDMVGVTLTAEKPVTLYKLASATSNVMGNVPSGGYVGLIQSWSKDNAGNVWWQVTTNVDDPESTDPADNSFVMHGPDTFDNDNITAQVTSSGNPVTDIQSGVSAREDNGVKTIQQMTNNADNAGDWIPGVPNWVTVAGGSVVVLGVTGMFGNIFGKK